MSRRASEPAVLDSGLRYDVGPKAMWRRASEPEVLDSGLRYAASKLLPSSSPSSPRLASPEALPSSRPSSNASSRSGSNAAVRSRGAARRQARPSPASSRNPSPEGSAGVGAKPQTRDDLKIRQMRALEVLLKDLAPSTRKLKDLVRLLMLCVMAPDGAPAFSKETMDHVCEMVENKIDMNKESLEECSPRSTCSVEITESLDQFMQELGHFSEPHCSAYVPETFAEETQLLVDRAVEVVAILSLRWLAIKHHISLPDMSDYQKQKWLPPAFSCIAGQILWRHRTTHVLKPHMATVENLRWITSTHGARDDMMDQCNLVFKILSGSAALMPLAQWRKVIELIATNPEMRLRVRRVDAVRACYGDAIGHAENGLSRKNFKLMLVKTADLLGVHPVVLFQELASHAEELETARKAQKENA